MIHRHCIQQTFHIPLIQLKMPPEIINTDATLEKMNFILMFRLQAHNFSLLYQEINLEFICHIPNWMVLHTPDPGPNYHITIDKHTH